MIPAKSEDVVIGDYTGGARRELLPSVAEIESGIESGGTVGKKTRKVRKDKGHDRAATYRKVGEYKRISTAEFYKVTGRDPKLGRRAASPIVQAILGLGRGRGMLIQRAQWTLKGDPQTYLHLVGRRAKKKFTVAKVAAGWAVLRIK